MRPFRWFPRRWICPVRGCSCWVWLSLELHLGPVPYSWKRRAVEPVTGWDYLKAFLTLILPLIVSILALFLFG